MTVFAACGTPSLAWFVLVQQLPFHVQALVSLGHQYPVHSSGITLGISPK